MPATIPGLQELLKLATKPKTQLGHAVNAPEGKGQKRSREAPAKAKKASAPNRVVLSGSSVPCRHCCI